MKGKKPLKQAKTVTLSLNGQSRTLPLPRACELANDHLRNNRIAAAIALAEQILRQHQTDETARLTLYRALAAGEQYEPLATLCQQHLQSSPRATLSLEYGAHALRQLGRDDDALPLLQKAVELTKTDARLLNALGTAYKEQGKRQKALDCFNRAAIIKPTFGQPYWNRSDLVDDHGPEIDVLRKNLKRLPDNARELPYFHFALYRALDAVGEYERAFAHLAKGNAAKKAQRNYRVEDDLANDRNIIAFFKENFSRLQQRLAGKCSDFSDYRALFIVGMPRSGTSLVEQILASHPEVNGGGELPLLTRATEMQLRRAGSTLPFPESLRGFSSDDFAQTGHTYARLIAPFAQGKPSVTDKFLLNYKAIPMIRLVLPNARIIHVERNAMDTCFGGYRQLFNKGLGFCYDLGDLAATWRSYRLMIDTWQQLPGCDFHTLRYESLVGDLEGNLRELLAFCDLPWQNACLEFHRRQGPVKTASSEQVRQPLFSSGIGRWQRYAQYLAPLQDSLGKH